MKLTWHYSINQFIVRTKNNNRRALELSLYHHAVLKQSVQDHPLDTDFAVMLARYAPVHQQFVDAYTSRNKEDGHMQGRTLGMKQQLTALRKHVDTWSAMVQVAGFERGSEVFVALFPHGRIIFSNGATDERIANVGALALAMQPHAGLNAARTLVEAYHQQLEATRREQVGFKGGKKYWAAKTETARKAVLTEQYRNLGRLMEKFADTPTMIEPFFKLKELRQRTDQPENQ